MALETKTTLKDKTLKKLQKLIRANIDSYDGLREAADQIEDQAVAELFRNLAIGQIKGVRTLWWVQMISNSLVQFSLGEDATLRSEKSGWKSAT